MSERSASTVVGSPSHPSETAGMSELSEDYGQDDVDLDPGAEDCPRGHADAGEACWDTPGDYKSYCSARWRVAGRADR